MKKYIVLFLTFSFILSCKKELNIDAAQSSSYQNISIDTLLIDSLSVRALTIDSNKVWYAANNGKYGNLDLDTKKAFNGHVAKDTFNLEFRSVAKTKDYIFMLTVGNPALLYRISKDGKKIDLVYQETHEKVFYDSMQFWNDTEGIAMGDPTDDCLSVIITRDGGANWTKLPCEKLPKVAEGEAAFAASNTNLIIKGNETWMVSGGKKSRVYKSSDKGNSWDVFDTPIVQGREMTGIFTADFYDAKNGFIAGGDYEAQKQNFKNKAVTSNGGKTWELIGEKQGFGYASCVQYVPNSNAQQLVCVGGTGIYYSSNSGVNWVQFSKDSSFHTIRFQNDSTAIAAGKNKIVRIRFNK